VPKTRTNKHQRYECFGEVIRYLTIEELQQFFDCIDNYYHKLMFKVIYESGCRVGEFVRIQVKHINFLRSTVFLPALNTKTHHARTSCLPADLTNELVKMLRKKGVIKKRDTQIHNPDAYLIHPGKRHNHQYTENRIRQIFQKYINVAGLQRVYAYDSYNRKLNMYTVHSLRHSHIMHYVVDWNVPLPIVQRQVGHRSLKTTSVYLAASIERIARAYDVARTQANGRTSPFSYRK